jgi:hypothetical protein
MGGYQLLLITAHSNFRISKKNTTNQANFFSPPNFSSQLGFFINFIIPQMAISPFVLIGYILSIF